MRLKLNLDSKLCPESKEVQLRRLNFEYREILRKIMRVIQFPLNSSFQTYNSLGCLYGGDADTHVYTRTHKAVVVTTPLGSRGVFGYGYTWNKEEEQDLNITLLDFCDSFQELIFLKRLHSNESLLVCCKSALGWWAKPEPFRHLYSEMPPCICTLNY